MSDQISFIHAADLHLDSPFKGLAHVPEHIFNQIQASTFAALDRLVQAAIEKQVDFVLIVGDLFDNEKQSLKAQVRLRRAFEELEHHAINVYLSYGNHDYTNGNIHPMTYPDNVFIFTKEEVTHFTFEKGGKPTTSIYGFSYENRSVTTKKAAEYQVADRTIPYHVAMLHGSLHSNTEHDVYAPFQISELREKDFDYWALGHIHQREILAEDPYMVYPGNIQGRNRKETGEKGCYYVSLSKTNTSTSFIPLQALQFEELSMDASDCEGIYQLEIKIQEQIKGIQKHSSPHLINLKLISNHSQLKKWETENLLEDIIELINETLIHQHVWTYIFKYTIESEEGGLTSDLYHGEHFVGELIRHFDDISIQPYVKELFHHKQARKYLETISEEDAEIIKDKAKQLLVNELLPNGGE
ncbi:exonuclease SbcCD subunit D [Virgibacillus byunsanensis]|uniref:Exonuclease SbcCD subunit D n=1 Tax=Virgibacillus byunsanensis TaxID=570945 RepID=A0ABW3LH08_9BACI